MGTPMGTLMGTLMGIHSAHPGRSGDSGWEKLARLQSWMLSTLAGEVSIFFAFHFKPFSPLPDRRRGEVGGTAV